MSELHEGKAGEVQDKEVPIEGGEILQDGIGESEVLQIEDNALKEFPISQGVKPADNLQSARWLTHTAIKAGFHLFMRTVGRALKKRNEVGYGTEMANKIKRVFYSTGDYVATFDADYDTENKSKMLHTMGDIMAAYADSERKYFPLVMEVFKSECKKEGLL